MSDDFIISNITFSHSSTTSYQTCPLSFKFGYIEGKQGIGNFFSDYGKLMHEIMELHFRGELEVFELGSYYKNNFQKYVVSAPPPYPMGLYEMYLQSGQDFFDNFEFDKDLYDVISIEEKVEGVVEGIPVVVKPDLILRHKESGEVIVFDFKSSNAYLKTGKPDKKKFEGYLRQLYLYVHFWNAAKELKITKMCLWFIRLNKMEYIELSAEDEQDAVDWLSSQIAQIKVDKTWKAIPDNTYFCGQICGFREICTFRKS